MAITEILTLFAAAVSAQPSAAERSRPAHLGVAATVVRPVEIVSISTRNDSTVAIVRSSKSEEVLADAGTVVHWDEHTATVIKDPADLLFVTIVF